MLKVCFPLLMERLSEMSYVGWLLKPGTLLAPPIESKPLVPNWIFGNADPGSHFSMPFKPSASME